VSGQLDLFGVEVRDGLPEPDPELVSLASRLPSHVRFGTSSWTFPGWAGLVYRRRYERQRAFVRESLAEYACHPLFRTVGVDRSFYAPVPEHELRAYAAQLPDGFECVCKVWSELTALRFFDDARRGQDNPRFLDAELFVEQVLEPTLAGLGEHTGPFVFEIPPTRGDATPERIELALARFLSEVPEGPGTRSSCATAGCSPPVTSRSCASTAPPTSSTTARPCRRCASSSIWGARCPAPSWWRASCFRRGVATPS